METSTVMATAAPENTATATAPTQEAVDNLTTAIMTGQPQAEIQRLEALAGKAPSPQETPAAVVEPKNEQETPAEEPAPEETPAEETPATPEPAEEAPEPSEPVGEQPQDDEKAPKRLYLQGLEDGDKRMVVAAKNIALAKGISFDEAWRLVNPAQAVEQQAQTTPRPSASDALTAELTRIDGELAEQEGSLVTTEYTNLLKERGKIEAKLAAASMFSERDQQANVQTQHQGAVNQSLAQAGDLYADLANQNSDLWKEANRIATDPSHPDYDPEMAAKPNGPLKIAKLAAANLGIKPKSAAPAATPTQVPKPVPPSVTQPSATVRPAAATRATAPAPPKPSLQEVVKRSTADTLAMIENGGYAPPSRVGRFVRL